MPKKKDDANDFHALVSCQIFLDEQGRESIEIFTQVHTDEIGCAIFDDIESTLLDYFSSKVKLTEDTSYFFIAHVRSWFDHYQTSDGLEVDVESEVTEINSADTLKALSRLSIEVIEDEEPPTLNSQLNVERWVLAE